MIQSIKLILQQFINDIDSGNSNISENIVIDEMSENIATCQNALDNYLETKKKIFPRFCSLISTFCVCI